MKVKYFAFRIDLSTPKLAEGGREMAQKAQVTIHVNGGLNGDLVAIKGPNSNDSSHINASGDTRKALVYVATDRITIYVNGNNRGSFVGSASSRSVNR